MADQQIEDLTAITAPADADEFLVNDVSDTTDDANGSVKKILYQNLFAYGEIRVEGNSTATTISGTDTAFGANAVQVTVFDTDGIERNCDADHTSDHISITNAGVYWCKAELSFSGGVSDTYSFAIFKNNKGTQLGARTTRKLGTGGDVGSASVSTIASLSASDTIEIWIQNEDAAADATIQDASLTVFRVG